MNTTAAFAASLVAVSFMLSAHAEPSTAQFSEFAGFPLWETTLSTVASKVGPSRVETSGEGAEFQVSICYRVGRTLVTFYSGEIGGGTRLEGILLGPATSARSCAKPERPELLGNLSIDGLRRGMTRTAFEAAIPVKVTWRGSNADFFYALPASTAKGADATAASGDAEIVVSGGAKFHAGKVIQFFVNRNVQ